MPTPPRDVVSAPPRGAQGGPGEPGPAAAAPGSPGRGRRGRAPAVLAAGLAIAAAGGFAARGLWPAAGRASAATADVPVAAAAVIRTDVSARQVVPGTLGYRGTYGVVDEAGPGIITWLPASGSIVRRGQVLFRLAGQPVTLLYGPVPAWRDFAPGMTPGPDVRELQRNLAVLGFGPGTADGRFGWATEAAVARWQRAHGLTVTGTIPLGQVTFLPGPLRVTAAAAPLGAPVATGATVLSGTSDTPAISVWLPVGGPVVQPGDPVLVTLPDGSSTVAGTVATVGRVAAAPSAAGSGTGAGTGAGAGAGASAGAGQGSDGTPSAAFPVTIKIAASRIPAGLDQAPVQVAITQQRDRNVLAVPVTALLALPGGGYAVRLTGPAGRLIPVTTGLFDDATGLVEVSGPGLAAGLSVAVARS